MEGIIEQRGKRRQLLTKNRVPGKTVYGERLVTIDGVECREWNPRRSKLGAAVLKGIPDTGIREDSVVLYLGAASGTTVSHVSDITAKGFVFALDFAPRVVRDLVYLAEDRKNIAPLLADANKPEEYFHRVVQADMVFQDIAQKEQAEIFLKNVALFLKKGGIGIISVKARSIDVTQKPKKIFQDVRKQLEQAVTILDFKTLEPFERDHAVFVCRKEVV